MIRVADAAAAYAAIAERRRAVVVLQLPLCSHDIVPSQHATCIENSPLNLKYVRLISRAAQRFPCYYARIMLDAFALLLFQKIFRHNYRKPTARMARLNNS